MNTTDHKKTKPKGAITVIVENKPSKAESAVRIHKLSDYISKVWKDKKTVKSPLD